MSNIQAQLNLKNIEDEHKLLESFTGNEYGDKSLLEETSRALDVAAGNQEQSPMVVLMASNRSHMSCGEAGAVQNDSGKGGHQGTIKYEKERQLSTSGSIPRPARKIDNEAEEAYDQKSSGGRFSYKTPRVLQLPTTDRSYDAQTGSMGAEGQAALLNDQSPIHILNS